MASDASQATSGSAAALSARGDSPRITKKAKIEGYTTRPQGLAQGLVLGLALGQALVKPWWEKPWPKASPRQHQGTLW